MGMIGNIISGLGGVLGFPETGADIGGGLESILGLGGNATGYGGGASSIEDLLGSQTGPGGFDLGGIFNAGNGIWGAISSGLGVIGSQVSNRKALEQASKQAEEMWKRQDAWHKDQMALAYSQLKLQKKANLLNAYNAAMQARGQAEQNRRVAGSDLTQAMQTPALMRSRG